MGSYLVIKDGQQIGPFDESEIIRQITEGILTPGDLCWQQGMANWQPISDFLRSGSTNQNMPTDVPSPVVVPSRYFLYIPISRLILMSILTFGMYELYWIFMNWDYLRDEKHMKVQPMSRVVFREFFIYSLLHRIHDDPDSNVVHKPKFFTIGLALVWIVLTILHRLFASDGTIYGTMIAPFIPSFLCLIPVQLYINAVRKKQYPDIKYFGWTTGHIIMLVIGCVLWPLIILGTIAQAFIK